MELLEQGMARLQNNLKSINEDCLSDVYSERYQYSWKLSCSLPLQKRDFHSFTVCSRLWHNCKRIIKRTTKWSAKYFTHDKSFYLVPTSSMGLADVEVMKPPTAARIDPPIEVAMKELVNKYRPVRQRTVRSETTKDKAGALPPAVYYTQPPHSKVIYFTTTQLLKVDKEWNKLCRKSQMTIGTRTYPASRLRTIARLI